MSIKSEKVSLGVVWTNANAPISQIYEQPRLGVSFRGTEKRLSKDEELAYHITAQDTDHFIFLGTELLPDESSVGKHLLERLEGGNKRQGPS